VCSNRYFYLWEQKST